MQRVLRATLPRFKKEKIAWQAGARKGNIMHNYPQNQTYVGSTGQKFATNLSMTPCNWQICHQTHVLCGCIKAWLIQGAGE